MSEARTLRLEEDVHDIKATLARLEPMIIRIDATLPHLATKAELADLRTELKTNIADLRTELNDMRIEVADKPGRLYLWGVMAAMVGAQAAALAAAVLALSIVQTPPSQRAAVPAGIVLASDRPFDWDRYHERQDACRELDQAQRACVAGGLAACNQALVDQLRRQCSAFGPLRSR